MSNYNRPNKKNTKQFIEESISKHGNKFGYDKCVYSNAHSKVIITCKKHGDFECKPNNHLNGSICKKCSIENSYMSTELFIQRINEIHKNKYKFDRTVYIHSMKDVIITCEKHGDFLITPNRILSGRGCQQCSEQRLSKEQFINNSIEVHGGKYNYIKVKYTNLSTPVEIICNEHGSFWQAPRDHVHSKSNCPSCVKCGYKRTSPGYFYVQELYLNNNLYSYKFGITNKTPNSRMNQQSTKSIYEHNIIFSLHDFDGDYIFKLEKYIINNITGKYVLKENMEDGYTETINPNDIDLLENLIIEYLINELPNNN